MPCKRDDGFDEECDRLDVNMAERVSEFPIDAEQIASCTMKDRILCTVMNYVENGWPPKVEAEYKPYFNRRYNFTT